MGDAGCVMIRDGVAEAAVVPRLGAGLAWYDLIDREPRVALFRPCREPESAHPFDLANNLLIPWSNRLSGGGFSFDGVFHAVPPNIPDETTPNHGNGFSSVWRVEQTTPRSVALALDSDGPGPYRYDAGAAYELSEGALTMRLSVRNAGDIALPFGLGFHPWFPRTPQTLLHAPAKRVVLEDSIHLPAGELPIEARKDWNFATPRRLPGAFINNAFLDWDGRATIAWPEHRVQLAIDAGPRLSTYIVYSPSSDADHFCFEPVTHPVDAHNAPGGPEPNGLVVLAPGASLSVSCRFAPSRTE